MTAALMVLTMLEMVLGHSEFESMYPVYVKILTTRQKVESEGSVALKKIFFQFWCFKFL